MSTPITLEEVSKRYRERPALAGVSFDVGAGEIVGLLGPNGAGKSTTLGVLATLVPFDAGRVIVAGAHLPAEAMAARRSLGLVPQQLAVYPTLSVRENLRFFAASVGLTARAAAAIARVLAVVGLAERAHEPVARLSIGMRRRLNVACGILHEPAVVLLDEPVVGVDPHSRERVFDAIRALAARGTAVLYSTHQMDEAERLCDRVVLLDAGHVVAMGTPASLVAGIGLTPRVELHTARPLPSDWLDDTSGARVLDTAANRTTIALADAAILPAVLAAVRRAGGEVLDVALQRPTLGDAFFALTGRALRDDTQVAV